MKNLLGFIAIFISSSAFSQYYDIYVSRYEAGYSDCYKEVTGRRPQSIPSLRREPTSTEVVDRNLAYNRGCSEGKRDAEDDGGSSRRQTAQLEYPTLSASDIAYARALGQAQAQNQTSPTVAVGQHAVNKPIIDEHSEQIAFYKQKISSNIIFIKSHILNNPKYDKGYDIFFNEMLPDAQKSLNSNIYEDVKCYYVSTENVARHPSFFYK